MYNSHKKLNKFYDEEVRLKEDRQTLIDARNLNLERVKEGTKKLSERKGKTYPRFADDQPQGSMAMFTINKSQHGEDQDIDHALIYEDTELTGSPEDARNFVADAINESGATFSKPPAARTNAVTVWYADGYHVDFAIYKRTTGFFGGHEYYHAGPEWAKRDPGAITEWFNTAVRDKSPGLLSSVDENQLRRIVRLLKFWSKSRSSWSLPSGLVLSVLAVECYVSDNEQDDISLIKTLENIKARLTWNQDVRNPTDYSISLLTNDEHKAQVLAFRDKLDTWIPDLRSALEDKECDESSALKAWKAFFNNEWWIGTLVKANRMDEATVMDIFGLEVRHWHRSRASSTLYRSESNMVIPKDMNIQFKISPRITPPYQVSWEVHNSGDEAVRAKQHQPRPGQVDPDNHHLCIEKSAFKGDHTVTCKIISDGKTYTKKIPVRIR